jgi:hypothetical protein
MIEIENEEDWGGHDSVGYGAVEDALSTLELVEPPSSLAINIIQELKHRPQLPRFRLLWFDYVLSLFVAGMLALIYMVGGALPTELKLYLRLQVLYWLQRFELDPWIPIIGMSGVLLVLMTFILARMLFQQFSSKEER